jgi:spore coat polysaccharide biosynthesis protein SpsF
MNTFVFIPVRLSSTRLPSKAFLKIENKSCLQYLIERIKSVKKIDGIVLCTTKNQVDDKLEKFAQNMNIQIFRGSEMDILERFKDAAIKYQVENIINIDGDDIFCNLEFITTTIKELNKSDVGFISWKNLPIGTTPVGIKASDLIKICNQKNTQNTETGWGRFFTETGLCKIKYLTSPNSKYTESDIRLTLDYPEDFKLFEHIIKNIKFPYKLEHIIEFLNERKDIKELNKKVKEEYWKNFDKKSSKIEMKKMEK